MCLTSKFLCVLFSISLKIVTLLIISIYSLITICYHEKLANLSIIENMALRLLQTFWCTILKPNIYSAVNMDVT